jgi:hypothetical protein
MKKGNIRNDSKAKKVEIATTIVDMLETLDQEEILSTLRIVEFALDIDKLKENRKAESFKKLERERGKNAKS